MKTILMILGFFTYTGFSSQLTEDTDLFVADGVCVFESLGSDGGHSQIEALCRSLQTSVSFSSIPRHERFPEFSHYFTPDKTNTREVPLPYSRWIEGGPTKASEIIAFLGQVIIMGSKASPKKSSDTFFENYINKVALNKYAKLLIDEKTQKKITDAKFLSQTELSEGELKKLSKEAYLSSRAEVWQEAASRSLIRIMIDGLRLFKHEASNNRSLGVIEEDEFYKYFNISMEAAQKYIEILSLLKTDDDDSVRIIFDEIFGFHSNVDFDVCYRYESCFRLTNDVIGKLVDSFPKLIVEYEGKIIRKINALDHNPFLKQTLLYQFRSKVIIAKIHVLTKFNNSNLYGVDPRSFLDRDKITEIKNDIEEAIGQDSMWQLIKAVTSDDSDVVIEALSGIDQKTAEEFAAQIPESKTQTISKLSQVFIYNLILEMDSSARTPFLEQPGIDLENLNKKLILAEAGYINDSEDFQIVVDDFISQTKLAMSKEVESKNSTQSIELDTQTLKQLAFNLKATERLKLLTHNFHSILACKYYLQMLDNSDSDQAFLATIEPVVDAGQLKENGIDERAFFLMLTFFGKQHFMLPSRYLWDRVFQKLSLEMVKEVVLINGKKIKRASDFDKKIGDEFNQRYAAFENALKTIILNLELQTSSLKLEELNLKELSEIELYLASSYTEFNSFIYQYNKLESLNFKFVQAFNNKIDAIKKSDTKKAAEATAMQYEYRDLMLSKLLEIKCFDYAIPLNQDMNFEKQANAFPAGVLDKEDFLKTWHLSDGSLDKNDNEKELYDFKDNVIHFEKVCGASGNNFSYNANKFITDHRKEHTPQNEFGMVSKIVSEHALDIGLIISANMVFSFGRRIAYHVGGKKLLETSALLAYAEFMAKGPIRKTIQFGISLSLDVIGFMASYQAVSEVAYRVSPLIGEQLHEAYSTAYIFYNADGEFEIQYSALTHQFLYGMAFFASIRVIDKYLMQFAFRTSAKNMGLSKELIKNAGYREMEFFASRKGMQHLDKNGQIVATYSRLSMLDEMKFVVLPFAANVATFTAIPAIGRMIEGKSAFHSVGQLGEDLGGSIAIVTAFEVLAHTRIRLGKDYRLAKKLGETLPRSYKDAARILNLKNAKGKLISRRELNRETIDQRMNHEISRLDEIVTRDLNSKNKNTDMKEFSNRRERLVKAREYILNTLKL